MTQPLLTAAALVLCLNVPFGYWRAGQKRLTLPWILAVHVPVPFVIAVRFLAHLGWHLVTFPVLASAFFAGQFVGGRIRRWRAGAEE